MGASEHDPSSIRLDPRQAAPLDQRYLDEHVVDQYEEKRYRGPIRGLKHRLWVRLLHRALQQVGDAQSVLDVPCGTGFLSEVLHDRFLLTVVSDVSPAMVRKTLSRAEVAGVVADIGRLPFPQGSVDCVVNVRFMVHFGHDERTRFLTELARVSRRWVLVNYNHRYTLKYALRLVRTALGSLPGKRTTRKCSRRELRDEAAAAGLRVVRVFPELSLPFLAERWMVLFEKTGR